MALFAGGFGGEGGTAQMAETGTQLAVRRRLAELWGLAFLTLGLLLGLALASYDAADPSQFSAPGAAPVNWLGRPGAVLADPLTRVLGRSAWFLVIFPVVWGLRLVLHRGDERIWARLLLLPIAVILGALFASTHTPPESWPLTVGLGGHLGDNGALALLRVLPLAEDAGVRALSAVLGAAALASWAAALGMTLAEARALGGWMLGSLGMVARQGMGAAATAGARQVRMRRAREAAPKIAPRAPVPDAPETAEAAEPPARPAGLGARIAGIGLGRTRRPEPAAADDAPAGAADRREPAIAGPGSPRRSRIVPAAVEAAPAEASAADSALGAAIRKLSRSAEALSQADRDAAREADALGLDREAAMRALMPEAAGAPRAMPAAGDERPPAPADPHDEAFGDGREAAGAAAGPEIPRGPRIAPAAPPAPAPAAPEDTLIGSTSRLLNRATDDDEDDDDETLRPAAPGEAPADPAPAPYDAPPLDLLQEPYPAGSNEPLSELALEENARQLETVLADYGVRGEIVAVKPGPVVTLYELEPAPGLKAARVIGLADDIARSMSALSARVSTVPGRSVIGIELPNVKRETVYLREVLEAEEYAESRHALALALGKSIEGTPCIANLAKMPHLLIAGTTGSGKSVAINTMILSLLYRLSPEQCRLIMIDPKMLELSVYDRIPHLLAPVVTDPKKALVALKWVVGEMEERYRKMSKMGVRNLEGYNARVREALARGENFSRTVQTGFDEDTGEPVFETETIVPEAMPLIVVIVDEMADLMMVAGKEIEACIQRLAQMARASGIHLIMATQRPSVDVITGTIKANFPTRISFQVTSKIDSRTILGEQGAEQLLGQGDMLYMAPGGRVRRVHGPFVSDDEVEEVVNHLKSLGAPDYVYAVIDGGDEETQAMVEEKLGLASSGDSEDELYDKAVAIVARDRKCSTSYIQRKLQIGYNKAARLVEQMEDQGVVSPANAVGKREILIEER
ncbi:hypothetical protein LNKW23_00940 [Paralimibaculum aggregatum]|uniref:DNA translocase FtsK n=1 Tax=Paralimibaculum aggregatum TaxID=3036245 RepID=A0ABQ6LBU8_9RHOB|nr:DNA translocase FtsK [Limibaculum sp. NKW23]GMG80882.1 hypothetical protein LNKW23_00940 [Limibaculum sp. NKW23]